MKKHNIENDGYMSSIMVAKKLLHNIEENISVYPCIEDMTKTQARKVLNAACLYSDGWGISGRTFRDLYRYIAAWKLGQEL